MSFGAVGWIATPAVVTAVPSGPTPKPAAPYGICQDCVKFKGTIDSMKLDSGNLRTELDSAKADVETMSKRLEASSGASVMSRQDETIAHLQYVEEIQRRANDHLECENRVLRELCDKHKVNIEVALALAFAPKVKP